VAPPRPPRQLSLLFLLLPCLPLLAACGGAPDGSFDAQPGTPSPSCLPHQRQSPGVRYTGGQASDPRAVLEMMRFYTAHGTKVFCDGGPATATDRQWTGLYGRLGGDPGHVPLR
jgi:hypothetical protein